MGELLTLCIAAILEEVGLRHVANLLANLVLAVESALDDAVTRLLELCPRVQQLRLSAQMLDLTSVRAPLVDTKTQDDGDAQRDTDRKRHETDAECDQRECDTHAEDREVQHELADALVGLLENLRRAAYALEAELEDLLQGVEQTQDRENQNHVCHPE